MFSVIWNKGEEMARVWGLGGRCKLLEKHAAHQRLVRRKDVASAALPQGTSQS